MGTERVRSYTHQRECHNWYHCDLSQSQVCIPGHSRNDEITHNYVKQYFDENLLYKSKTKVLILIRSSAVVNGVTINDDSKLYY